VDVLGKQSPISVFVVRDVVSGGDMGFLDGLFRRRGPTSSEVAKERLQLVLVHDRIKISPAMLDQMKDELITVISRYVEIESSGVEVTFTQGRRESRLVADIPVVGPAIAPGGQRRSKRGQTTVRAGGGSAG
jgi:cell division topological specificity factor